MEYEDPKALKEQRSKLRAKVTTAAKNLARNVESCTDVNELQTLHDALIHLFEEFTVCQLAYEELVESDEKYSAYKVVGGLDLEAYQAYQRSQLF
jgi:regulator of replication initiation timing